MIFNEAPAVSLAPRTVRQEQVGPGDFGLWIDVATVSKELTDRTTQDVPATSAASDALSKDMKRRGFKFVGSTIMYAHMQATGLVNDHLVDCFRYRQV